VIKQLKKYPFATDLFYPVSFDEDVYLLKNGSIGLIWECRGAVTDGKGKETLEGISKAVATMFKSLPEDTSCQIILFAHPGADDLETFLSGDLSNEYVKEYMGRKIEWHDKCKETGFAREGQKLFLPRTIRTFFTIQINPIKLSSIGLYNEQNWQQTMNVVKNVRTTVETALQVAVSHFRRIKGQEIIEIFYKILNPNKSLITPAPQYTGNDLREYFLRNAYIEVSPDGFYTDNVKYNVLSFLNVPAHGSEDGLITKPNILFSDLSDVTLYDFTNTFIFTINFWVPNQELLKRNFSVKRTLSFIHRFNLIGDVAIDKEIARQETTKVLESMYSGEKLLKASFHVCFPTEASADKHNSYLVNQILSYLNVITAGNVIYENLIGGFLFLRCLPFGFNFKIPDEQRFVRRAVFVPTGALADVVPFYTNSRGVKSHAPIGYYNRKGETLWLDLFNSETAITAPHCLITGATGAGKSVTTVDFISQALRQPSTVVVIDKGNSYKKLCYLSGGQYLSFEGEPDYILDPFWGDFSDEHKSFLVYLISIMATGGTENERISREENAIISESVNDLTKRTKRNFQSLIEILNTKDELGKIIARKLYPFYGAGQYARVIESSTKPKLELTHHLTVFELGDIDAYKDYQTVVVFLLIYYITQFMKKVQGNKYLIIDEAWSLFKNETAVDFLIKAVKTFRKLGCSVVFITQQIDDFALIAKAINMKDNCPNKILLYQEPDVVLKHADMLELTDGEKELYKTIKKARKFSEAMFKMQQWTAVGRITLDPESYWIATTSEPDIRYLDSLMQEQNLTLKEAIKIASEKYPYGVK